MGVDKELYKDLVIRQLLADSQVWALDRQQIFCSTFFQLNKLRANNNKHNLWADLFLSWALFTQTVERKLWFSFSLTKLAKFDNKAASLNYNLL